MKALQRIALRLLGHLLDSERTICSKHAGQDKTGKRATLALSTVSAIVSTIISLPEQLIPLNIDLSSLQYFILICTTVVFTCQKWN